MDEVLHRNGSFNLELEGVEDVVDDDDDDDDGERKIGGGSSVVEKQRGDVRREGYSE